MREIELYSRLHTLSESPAPLFADDGRAQEIALHKIWPQTIRRERPSTEKQFKIGVYIRYFNQTKHSDYLSYHKKQFRDTIELCPAWELIDFYVDEGSTPPNMESAPQWGQLLQDCVEGKVNVIFFIPEDIFTLASYYLEDMRDTYFLPDPSWKPLPDGASPGG